MDNMKVLGILYIILGLIFAIYPLVSAQAVSIIAGIAVMAFGFAMIIDGFSVWSRKTHLSVLKILIGICSVIFGLLFIYKIDALSFLVAFQFYLISFVMILGGIIGILLATETMSKIASFLIIILGVAAFFVATFSIAEPLYAAIFIGICLILEGMALATTDTSAI